MKRLSCGEALTILRFMVKTKIIQPNVYLIIKDLISFDVPVWVFKSNQTKYYLVTEMMKFSDPDIDSVEHFDSGERLLNILKNIKSGDVVVTDEWAVVNKKTGVLV